MLGICRKYWPEKGYGFCRADESKIEDADIFIHHKQLPFRKNRRKYLYDGERIEFDLGEYNGRPVALNVRSVDDHAEMISSPVMSGVGSERH
jgi:cold shock CspA family protein